MNTPATDPLAQLESFLEQDPGNDGLRAEAFETALRVGRFERAESHLRAGLAGAGATDAWRLRHAHLRLAEHRWADARAELESLSASPDPQLQACALQDLAYVALRENRAADGIALLAPRVRAAAIDVEAPLQALWLRLQHRANRIDDVLEEATRWAAAGRLAPSAAGVAALAALDGGDFVRAKAWSAQALAAHPEQAEALVALGSIALAEQQPGQALALLERARSRNPDDGRTESALALAELQAGRLPAARARLARAVELMPSHIGTWHALGWASLLQDDLPAACTAFEHALDLDRNFAESHGGLAVVLARKGRRAEAEGGIERALRLDRRCLSAHYARSVLDGSATDAEAMKHLAQRLLAKSAQNE